MSTSAWAGLTAIMVVVIGIFVVTWWLQKPSRDAKKAEQKRWEAFRWAARTYAFDERSPMHVAWTIVAVELDRLATELTDMFNRERELLEWFTTGHLEVAHLDDYAQRLFTEQRSLLEVQAEIATKKQAFWTKVDRVREAGFGKFFPTSKGEKLAVSDFIRQGTGARVLAATGSRS